MERRVLLVDDEPSVTESLKRALRKEPYTILSVRSGQEAMDCLAELPVDVIIADEKMPGMRGTELLAKVRQHYPETIRMVLTGYASMESAVSAINDRNVYRFFTKPCDPVELGDTIRQAIREKALKEQVKALIEGLPAAPLSPPSL